MASDGSGGVLVGLATGIARLDREGHLTVVTGGDGGGVSAGDGGPAGAARFTSVRAVAGDGKGNIFVADGTAPSAVRFVNRGDAAETFSAGQAGERVVAPGTVQTLAVVPGDLGEPFAMTSNNGALYVAVSGPRPAVLVMNLGKTPNTTLGVTVGPGATGIVAGGQPAGFRGDGGPAREAALSGPAGLGADSNGNLFFADQGNHRVRRVDDAGIITTVAGVGRGGAGGFNGNGRPATLAQLNRPVDVKVGRDGHLVVSDQLNGQVRTIDASGLIHTLPGGGAGLNWACVGDRQGGENKAHRDIPELVAADGRGNVFFASARQVRRIDASGRIRAVTDTIDAPQACRPPARCNTGDGGPAFRAIVGGPHAIAAGLAGLYLLDSGESRVRFVDIGNRGAHVHGVTVGPGMIEAVAGTSAGGTAGERRGRDLIVSGQGGLAADSHGNLFLADRALRRVTRLDPRGRITQLAGPVGTDPGRCCLNPSALATTPAGNLYVADISERRIWFLNLGRTAIVVNGRRSRPATAVLVAGNGTAGVGGDGGSAVEAQFQAPVAVAADRVGNLYVADASDNTVRRVDPRGTVSTVVGTGQFGFNGDGMKGTLTSLNSPSGLAIDACGNLVIADSQNGRIRRLNLGGSCLTTGAGSVSSGRDHGAVVAVIAAVVAFTSIAVGAKVLSKRART